jgi:hypothetical protein
MKTQNDFKSLPLAARCTIVLFGLAGLTAILYGIALQRDFDPGRIFLLLALAAGSARLKLSLFKGSTLSFLTSVVLLAVIKEGPAAAILVGICGVTAQNFFPSKQLVLHQLAFNAGMIAVTVTASWWTYHVLAVSHAVDAMSAKLTATILASFTYFLGNSISVSWIIGVTKGVSAVQIWFRHFLFSAPSFMIAGLLALSVIAIGSQSSFVAAVLLIAICVAYYCSVRVTVEAAGSER